MSLPLSSCDSPSKIAPNTCATKGVDWTRRMCIKRSQHQVLRKSDTVITLEDSSHHKQPHLDAWQAARISFEKKSSTLPDKTDLLPKFSRSEVMDGRRLGKGAFSTVYEVRGFQCFNSADQKQTSIAGNIRSAIFGRQQKEDPMSLACFLQSNLDHSERLLREDAWVPSTVKQMLGRTVTPKEKFARVKSRDFMASHCFRNSGEARYAIKCLSKETKADPEAFVRGILDVATEAHILSNLNDHPHVLKIRAVSEEGPFNGSYDFFVLIDRLYDTLEGRIKQWSTVQRSLRCAGARLFRRNPIECNQSALYEDRLMAAFHVASALAYIHGHRIIHRDLKPANLGFDIRDDMKIFDFGFARVLPECEQGDKGSNQEYRLTQMVGSLRYMAPEVALGKMYNEKCDTYSFAILLWEILFLEKPFQGLKAEAFYPQVWQKHVRPPLETRQRRRFFRVPAKKRKSFEPEDLSMPLRALLQTGWSPDPQERPFMSTAEGILREECLRNLQRGGSSQFDNRCPSTDSFAKEFSH